MSKRTCPITRSIIEQLCYMEGTVNIKRIARSGVNIAVIKSDEAIIIDTDSALDLIATVRHETGCDRAAISKRAFTEDFFVLSTGLAGEILQKFVNYHFRVAVVGDFSQYTSKPLRDFMYESNKGDTVFFVGTEEEALNRLASVKN